MGNLLNLFKRLRQRQASPVPEALWQAAEKRLPCIACLPEDERATLRERVAAFLDDKVFCGARGFEPDDLVRLSVAMQACLPVLRLGLSAYAGWRGIVVYPGEFVIPRRLVDEDGVLHEYDEDALGESWDGGPVILSWYDDPADYAGANVVIHEFVHKIDMLNGEADGLPPLHSDITEAEWLAVLDGAYEDFCDRVDADEDTAIDPYAAEHPAEFFAVTSEVFFTEPALLQAEYPALYDLFRRFYRLDPVRWPLPARPARQS